jgi:hypothetical protein
MRQTIDCGKPFQVWASGLFPSIIRPDWTGVFRKVSALLAVVLFDVFFINRFRQLRFCSRLLDLP